MTAVKPGKQGARLPRAARSRRRPYPTMARKRRLTGRRDARILSHVPVAIHTEDPQPKEDSHAVS